MRNLLSDSATTITFTSSKILNVGSPGDAKEASRPFDDWARLALLDFNAACGFNDHIEVAQRLHSEYIAYIFKHRTGGRRTPSYYRLELVKEVTDYCVVLFVVRNVCTKFENGSVR